MVRWPGHIKPGSTSDQLICLNDVMATCAAVVGASLPDNAAEDSFNMLPAMLGNAREPLRESLVHHDVKGNFALRQGPWKLVIRAQKEGDPVYELYNLEEDIAETVDRSSESSAEVLRLLRTLSHTVDYGRSTPGGIQPNDTLDIDVFHLPAQRWANPR
jgi:arylsulfatase A-like enzyme